MQDTARNVKQLVNKLYRSGHIDLMTHKWLTTGLEQPRIPEFYTLTKIHKKTPVGRPIVSGSSGPTERISSFVDSLLQPVAIKQESYIKDTTDFINFIENTQIPDNVVLATLDVSSLYTNIPQEEGIDVVCRYYEDHYEHTEITYTDKRFTATNAAHTSRKLFQVQWKTLRTNTALLWEPKWLSLSPLFSWRTLKIDC